MIDCNGQVERHFDFEKVEDPYRGKFVAAKLRGHASLWCDHVQKDRVRKNKEKIRIWKKMVSKIKEKFLHADYRHNLFRQVRYLRQKYMNVIVYTK
jgi:hypothetical protein